MTTTDNPSWMLIDWHDLRRIDTRAMPWAESAESPGVKIKVLARDNDGRPATFIQWIPPGGVPALVPPVRHYHRSVAEYAYVLSGELPCWEYADAVDRHGDLVVLREGYFVERESGAVHGFEPGIASSTGATIMCWREGAGTMVGEPEFVTETVDVPYPDDWAPIDAPSPLDPAPDGVVLERAGIRILDTRAMEWTPWGGPTGMKARILARHPDGDPSVFLIWLPPGELTGINLPARHYHSTVTERSFMLAGELPHWEYRSAQDTQGTAVVVRPGWFMERLPGSVHGLEPGPTSQIGALILFRQTGSGNWVHSPRYHEETVDVPY